MQGREAVSVSERKTLGERVTFELELEALVKVWGGFCEEGSSRQEKPSMFSMQGLFQEGKV